MSKTKNDLISYAPPTNQGGEEIVDFINDNLNDDLARRCLKYLMELEESKHPHSIREIGYDDNGKLFVKTGTGMTFL